MVIRPFVASLYELAGDAAGADSVLDGMGGGAAGGAPAEVLLKAAERKLQKGNAGEAWAYTRPLFSST